MRTWEEYKNYVKAVNEEERQQVEEIEAAADSMSLVIKRRQGLASRQRASTEDAEFLKPFE
ncbi:MAG TPA: hypothetical protein DDY92_06315 [Dialister sp.]|nr:hypothetical protein [Dialister sp.]